MGLPMWFSGKGGLPANAGNGRDPASIPGSGRTPGGVNGNSLQDSCVENPMDRGASGLQHRYVIRKAPQCCTHTHWGAVSLQDL